MKQRQKQMLRYMLINSEIHQIDKLAETFSIGKRTVSRDLDILDKWLSMRGSRLERKQNHGIRVLGFTNTNEKLLNLLNKPTSFLETLTPSQRQKHILIYLLYNNREIKITEIAGTFFISDTSVWNDMNQIEKEIENEDFQLIRSKGVGIKLVGDEVEIRLYFLKLLTQTFKPQTIIPYLYNIKEDSKFSIEVNQFKLIIQKMNITEGSTKIHALIDDICKKIGYKFTMSGEALLYFYLQISLHRIRTGAIIQTANDYPCTKTILKIGEECLNKLTNSSFSGDIPIYEISLLGVILQTLEVGDSNIENIKGISSLITVKIKNLTNKMITEFSKSDKKLYYLNDNIEAVLSLSLAVLILRLNYKIPFWHGNWGDTSQEDWGKDEKVKILSSLIKKSFGIETTLFDLDNILLQFHSLVLLNNQRIKQRLRTVICCFEGVGIAAYLQTILQQEIEDIEIIEATAVYKLNQEYIDKKQVELVISTFPINDINIPVIEVSLPLNKGEIISQITSSAKDINKTEYKIINKAQKESALSFDIIIDFIHYFKLISLENIYTNNEIIGQLSKNLTTRPQDEEELNLSLQKREDLGPLYFDEYGIKILHCKSRAVTVPTAGVIEFHDKSIPRIIYMIAPDPCSDIYRKLLSTITVSFLENRNFRNSVQFGNIDEIRKNLMNIYKELI